MKSIAEIREIPGFRIVDEGYDGVAGILKVGGMTCSVIFSWGGGWEHLSVAPRKEFQVLSWDDMCVIKDMFWKDDEITVEYHPAKSNYVNIKKNCLHMWRPIGVEIPIPPTIYV